MDNFWNTIYTENSLSDWIIAAAIVAGGFLFVKLLRVVVLRSFKRWSMKTNTSFDDFIAATLEKSLIPFLYFLCVYIALSFLKIPDKGMNIIQGAMLLVSTFFVLRTINEALQYFIFTFLQKQPDGAVKQKQAKGLLVVVKMVIWTVGIIFLLDNLGYNVTTIIAGLGIGGIAIALAAQTILGDLFSYFVILFDRPFEIGDFIIVDEKMGVVEYIGIKTTRLRTLGGEQLVCSNKDLTDSRVHNFKRMEKRRIVFNFGVTYDTPAEMLQQIPLIVKEIISKQADVLFDRGHFSAFGDSKLHFEFVYYVLSSDYNLYMDRQQSIFLEVYKTFERLGIEFAFPTQTVYLNKVHPSVDTKKNGIRQMEKAG